MNVEQGHTVDREQPRPSAPEGYGRSRRPFGVAVIAVVQGANTVVLGLEVAAGRRGLPGPTDQEAFLVIVGAVVVLAGLVTAIGLWRLARWAWVATMVWVGFVMALAFLAYIGGSPSYPVMVLSVLEVLYLNQSEVQRAFLKWEAEAPVP